MALVKQTIKNDILSAFTAVMNDESDNRQQALETVADALAVAVVNAVRSATVKYTGGLSNGGGTVVGTFLGGLE